MREEIRHFFVKEGIAPGRIVAAVSGGVDSTALLIALHELGLDVLAAHVNHRLRGADSDADEAFVRDLCSRLAVPFRVADGALDGESVRARGIEAAAREVRYAALARIRDAEGARYVATAHQKNDQAETVLMRLVTGSGIAGLRGIHSHRSDGFIRPLLGVMRAETEAFLAERNVVARFDRSNDDLRFLRNRVRAFLREVDAVENLVRVADQARAQWSLLERLIDENEDAELSEETTIFRTLPDDEWLRGALLQRHIRRLDPQARDFDASRLATDGARRISVTKNLELVRKGGKVILRKRLGPTPDFEHAVAVNGDTYIAAIGRMIHIVPVEQRSLRPAQGPAAEGARRSTGGVVIELPAGAEPTFTVRNRRDGDRFHPLGMAGPKKLKDFLIDRRIDADVRDRLPLLVWNGDIVWIAGVEVSERFKVRGAGGMLCEVWIDERDTPSGLQR